MAPKTLSNNLDSGYHKAIVFYSMLAKELDNKLFSEWITSHIQRYSVYTASVLLMLNFVIVINLWMWLNLGNVDPQYTWLKL